MESKTNNSLSSTVNIVAFFWIVSLLLVGFVGYYIGQSTTSLTKNTPQTPVAPTTAEISLLGSTPTPTIDLESICVKSGPSQKKDYLIPYILKEGDSFQSIAEKELGDATRVSELTTLNADQTNLTLGSTIYLPPPQITSSSGHIYEISGKIVQKDNATWQLTYGGGKSGPGLLIPAYYLKDIPNLDSFHVGDCVTVLLDNGVKAYSIKKM